ncbi:MAG: TlpA family protein disulfide reductase [Actinobacteria bacterium]|nr:TlpA family protein disulfide reductase [Actinomycetota bacterium]
MIKKILILIMILSMLLFIFAGCKDSSITADIEEGIDEAGVTDESKVESREEEVEEDLKADDESEDNSNDEEASLDEDEYVNDFTLLDLDNNEVSLSDFKGKIVVINFWATGCPPCRAELPDFVEVYNEYKDKNVQFIGIGLDNAENLKAFAEEYNISYPTLIDGSIDTISGRWRINFIPTTYIVNENGKVVVPPNVGMMTKKQLIDAIEEWL